MAEGAFVYIRNERDGTEVLCDERDDPRELTSRARADAFKPVLERFGQRAARVKSRTPGMPR
jgi:hypothetical protein